MSLNLKYQSLDVKPIGRTVTIPDDKLAKLMYYLDCVFTVIQIDESTRLTDFQNYYYLTKEEEQTVLGLCALFNPKVMTELSLFILAPELVPYGSSNEFYQITDDRIGVHVNSEVVIGGRVVKVLKIMACKPAWIDKFFIQPAESYSRPQLTSGYNYSNNNYNRNNNYTNYRSNNTSNEGSNNSCKKKACYFFIVVIIICVIVYFAYNN